MARFLLAGVPQLLSPEHVESHLAARRVEALGAGVAVRAEHGAQDIAPLLDQLLSDARYKTQAMAFAQRYRGFDSGRAAEVAVAVIEGVAPGRLETADMARAAAG